jgi:hypothetical protein
MATSPAISRLKAQKCLENPVSVSILKKNNAISWRGYEKR